MNETHDNQAKALSPQTQEKIINLIESSKLTSGLEKGLVPDYEFVPLFARIALFIASDNREEPLSAKLATSTDGIENIEKLFKEVVSIIANVQFCQFGCTTALKKADGTSEIVAKRWKPQFGNLRLQEAVKKRIVQLILECYRRDYKQIPSNPDPKKFLECVAKLFPNFMDAEKASNALYNMCNNIHATFGTPGAVYRQKMLWLYSEVVGGCGKTYFFSALKKCVADRFNGDVVDTTFDPSNIVVEDYACNLTIFNDMSEVMSSSEEKINCLIDHIGTKFNIKCGAKGTFIPTSVLAGASNYLPPKKNTRRYDILQLFPITVDRLDEETKKTYYNDTPEQHQELVYQMIVSCPISSKDKFFFMPKDDIVSDDGRIECPAQYIDLLCWLEEFINTKHPETKNSSISKFVDSGNLGRVESEIKKSQLKNFLMQVRSDFGLFRNSLGTPIGRWKWNWQSVLESFKISDMEVSEQQLEARNLQEIKRIQW